MSRALLHIGLALVLLTTGLGLPLLAQGAVEDGGGWGATAHTIGYTHDSSVARALVASASLLRPASATLATVAMAPDVPRPRLQRGAARVTAPAPAKSDSEQPGTGAALR